MLTSLIEIIIGVLIYQKLPALIDASGLLNSLVKLLGILVCLHGLFSLVGIHLF